MTHSEHQNKYDFVLKIQFRNKEGIGKGGRRVNSHLSYYKFRRKIKFLK